MRLQVLSTSSIALEEKERMRKIHFFPQNKLYVYYITWVIESLFSYSVNIPYFRCIQRSYLAKSSPSSGVENIDYNRYPDEEFQREWIRSYISHYQSVPPESVEESQVSQWYVWVNKFALASHIFWGVWAILQACHSSIDFDFFG